MTDIKKRDGWEESSIPIVEVIQVIDDQFDGLTQFTLEDGVYKVYLPITNGFAKRVWLEFTPPKDVGTCSSTGYLRVVNAWATKRKEASAYQLPDLQPDTHPKKYVVRMLKTVFLCMSKYFDTLNKFNS